MGNGYSTTLPLEYSHKETFSRLYSIETEFYFLKTKKLLFEPPFEGFGVNVCTTSMAHWKAHRRLPIGDNGTFLLSLTVEML